MDTLQAPHPERATVASLSLEPGRRFKHYEIIRELGRGGMGRVLVARDLKLGRKVALKFLARPSPEFQPRFLIEARATARCSHENIVVIHEVDEYEGQPYMALELLEGRSLSELLAFGPAPAERAVELMLPVVRALVHAHSLEIVHCDLKPDNIFITSAGLVKVFDFGVAKLVAGDEVAAGRPDLASLENLLATGSAGLVGTLPYMSPEQWGMDEVDHRADIWAVGIVFWELLTGHHPLDPLNHEKLWTAAAELDEPIPSIASVLPSAQGTLARIIDRCLAKRKVERYGSARDLLDDLGKLVPARARRNVGNSETPFPGLRAFQESDADKFFGRVRDVQYVASRVREFPLVGVIGASGVGKSSFVRAGLIPMFLGSGDAWEVLIARPGRRPLASLASLVDGADPSHRPVEEVADQLRSEPGYLGTALRSRAEKQQACVLLHIDQFEELYTLTADFHERRAFTDCLAGVADDPASPLRVIISMRSDFIDRIAEDRAFMDQLAPGLLFLPPPDRDGLREALVQPLAMVGFHFETPELLEDIVSSLQGTPGALPLLQFVGGSLWETRDQARRLVTRSGYDAMGGVAGILANHANRVLAGMSFQSQRLARGLFQRLVTSDRTRAIVGLAEIAGLSADRREVVAVVDLLVAARLLIVQNRGQDAEPTVEIVHESLIHQWPTLRRWLDEIQEDAAFLEQLRAHEIRWAHSRGALLPLSEDGLARRAGYCQDVTDRKLKEEAVRVSQERLAEAQRLARLGSWSWEVGNNLVTWSDELFRIYGLEPGSSPATFEAYLSHVHPDDRERVERAALRTRETHAPFEHEYRIVRPSGEERWVHARGEFVEYRRGGAARMIGYCQDITERRSAEQERERLEGHLPPSECLKRLDQLDGGVAHEFNNLLTAILSSAAFVEEKISSVTSSNQDERSGPMRADVEKVAGAARRAAELTQEFLAFGRLEVVRPRLVDLNEVIHNVEPLLWRTVGEKVALRTRLALDLWLVSADPGQLEQVLVNLALNARDAMPTGGALTIKTGNFHIDLDSAAAQRSRPGSYVQLRVGDTGHGMSREVATRAFEPFFTTKPKGRGTGLGLATVFGIVAKAEGTVHIASELGRGTMVSVLLPAAERR